MSSFPPSPAIHFPNDDRDLDDADLWSLIDSAAASRPRNHPPLLSLKNSTASEIIQDDHWTHRRPPKTAKLTDHRMVFVKNSTRNLTVTSPSLSPSAEMAMYSAPASGRYSMKEVSPVVESPPPSPWVEEKENLRPHSLAGRFPSVTAFKQYQNAAMAILEKTDYTMISGSPYIKKSGWRKISFYFNLSFEIRDKSIEFDDNRNVQRAEFVVRAYMQGGRFSDGWGSCDRREKRFMKPNHDIPSTAETRAKNKACQTLVCPKIF